MRSRLYPPMNQKILFFSAFLVLIFAFGCTSQSSAPPEEVAPAQTEALVETPPTQLQETGPDANALFAEAEALFTEHEYAQAEALYTEAEGIYSEQGKTAEVRLCKERIFSMDMIRIEFTYNESAAKEAIAEKLPDATVAQIDGWLLDSRTQYFMIDGEKMYTCNLVSNIYFQNPELMMERERVEGNAFKKELQDVVYNESHRDRMDSPYTNPINYTGTERLDIAREELPESGLLRLWIPIAVETDSQRNVELVSVSPEEYLVSNTTEGDIGLAYLEVPLGELQGDLNITVVFTYTSYEQHFDVDPAKVGAYDTESELYRKYTQDGPNIKASPQTRALALQAVGNETNPYLQAEKLYWFVFNTTTYNLMPHLTLSELGIPESEYSREHGVGDCGTQSIYFSALARSIGIPARAAGGYQLIRSTTSNHFWAEAYIPDYGWVPLDITVGELAIEWYGSSEEERGQFESFFFGNLDAYRYVIQKDVDATLVPEPGERVFFPLARQSPAVLCDTCGKDIVMAIEDGWKATVEPSG